MSISEMEANDVFESMAKQYALKVLSGISNEPVSNASYQYNNIIFRPNLL